jgi:FLVCR family MFS transporter
MLIYGKFKTVYQGLRVGMMVSALLMAFGTSIRCISMNETIFTWMAHSGANFNGIAGIVLCAVPPALSSHW